MAFPSAIIDFNLSLKNDFFAILYALFSENLLIVSENKNSDEETRVVLVCHRQKIPATDCHYRSCWMFILRSLNVSFPEQHLLVHCGLAVFVS